MYQGMYGGKQYHEPDLAAVLERSWAAGVERIIVTGGTLEGSRAALALARTDSTPKQSLETCALPCIGRQDSVKYPCYLGSGIEQRPLASSSALPAYPGFNHATPLPLVKTSVTLGSSSALATPRVGRSTGLLALVSF